MNDLIKQAYTDAGYTSEWDWLMAIAPAGSPTSIDDLWSAFLRGEGYTGGLNDMKLAWAYDVLEVETGALHDVFGAACVAYANL